MSSFLVSPNLQIFDNAAFDDSAGPQWHQPPPSPVLPLQPLSFNALNPSKENRSPLRPQSQSKIKKPPVADIDAEIADVEAQIRLLSKKLESLKIKKSESAAAAPRPRGRIIPAKFLNLETPKKIQDSPFTAGRAARRGVSLGPSDIPFSTTPFPSRKPAAKLEGIKEENEKQKGKILASASARRRGMSLGPSEILRQASRAQEAKVKKAARSLSTSPKTRKPANSKVAELRKGVATVGAKKPARLDEVSMSAIKPKTLFQEKKRPLKSNAKVRVVASRYSLGLGNISIDGDGSKRRKWSLPEPEKEKEEDKNRSLSLDGGANVSPPASIMRIGEALPKIKTLRCAVESPRDSGCAKRVADLVGRKSCFFDEGGSSSSCQSLSFEDVEDQ